MPTATGTYEQIDGSPVVRFERTFPHAPGRFWAAITDPAGDVLISDTGNNRIREVAG